MEASRHFFRPIGPGEPLECDETIPSPPRSMPERPTARDCNATRSSCGQALLEEHLSTLTSQETKAIGEYLESKGGSVKPWMRDMVLKWMVDTAYDYRYPSDTVSLAVVLFDRYLAARAAKRSSLQLLATTCLLLAVKFLEVEAPALDDLAGDSDGAYTAREIKAAELGVLEALGWSIPTLTPHAFLRAFVAARCETASAAGDAQVARTASFFLDMAFTGYHFLRFPPAVLGAGAVLAACSGSKGETQDHVQARNRIRGEVVAAVAASGPRAVTQAHSAAADVLALFRELFPAEAAGFCGADEVPLTPVGGKRSLPDESASGNIGAESGSGVGNVEMDSAAESGDGPSAKRRRGTVVSPPTVLQGPISGTTGPVA